jgi:hypothetical protein
LDYERALELDKLLEDIEEQKENSKRATKTPALRRESFATPVTSASNRSFSTPLKTPGSNTNRQSSQPRSEWDADTSIFNLDEEASRTTREQTVKKHFDDWVYPGWQDLVAVEDDGVRPRPIGLERFDAGESADGTSKDPELDSIHYRACLH